MNHIILYNDCGDLKSLQQPENYIDMPIILQIDIEHNDFKHFVIKALKYNFRHPLISSKIFDITLDKPSLFLYNKFNHNTGKVNTKWKKQLKYIAFALESFCNVMTSGGGCSNCTAFITLDKNATRYLEQYTKKFKFKFNSGGIEQREISGKFLMNALTDNFFILSVEDKNSEYGEKDHSGYFTTIASFHTHPTETYEKYNVCIAWPSTDDYTTFLYIYAQGHGFLHIVSTVEGIYIISISDTLLHLPQKTILDEFQEYEKSIRNNYGYSYPVCKMTEYSGHKRKIFEYIENINKKPYFHLQFVEWIDIGKTFKINYKRISGNCFTTDEQIKLNNFINQN
jgi:hypothetical protein